MARANGSVNKLGDLQREAGGNQVAIKRLQVKYCIANTLLKKKSADDTSIKKTIGG